MKTLTLDLNKLTKEQLQAYLMLSEVSEEQFKEQNKGWMEKEIEGEKAKHRDISSLEEDGEDIIS